MPEIVFPASTAPSDNPSEGGGRLINVFAEPAPEGSRSKLIYRSAPGLEHVATVGTGPARGALQVGSLLYVVNEDKAYSVDSSFAVTDLTGTVGGAGKVTMARNMAATPNILIEHTAGMESISAGAVNDFSDADLPAANSVSFLDAYFLFTIANGKVWSSGINAVTVNANDNITCEASPDGLVRGVVKGRDALFMGDVSTEVWSNAGNPSGFPLSRSAVLEIGLLTKFAVAGFEYGFPGDLCWVGNDFSVRRLDGYTPVEISPPYLKRRIERLADKSTLEASVFSAGGHDFWVLKCPDWTWVYDLTTRQWHERKTIGSDTWFPSMSVYAFGSWFVFGDDGKVYKVVDGLRYEGASQVVCEMRSTQAHRFPGRMTVHSASFDIETGVGVDTGIEPIETDPQVGISWSDDGGRTWVNPVMRSLGTEGETVRVIVNRCGMTGPQGRQWKLQIADPVVVSVMGGSMTVEERA